MRRLLTVACALGLAVALALAGTAAAAPKYEPGKVLVRFESGVDAAARDAVAHRAGLRMGPELPVVPDLYELEVPHDRTVPAAVRALARDAHVRYAEPNDVVKERADAAPDAQAYYPNDPYFWPVEYANPDRCSGASELAQWASWPLGKNLSDTQALGAGFAPPGIDSTASRGGDSTYGNYASINVLPVWNALREAGRPEGKTGVNAGGQAVWTPQDIRRSGIGIVDTGLSDHEDINRQIAALFSTRTAGGNTYTAEVYRDDPNRDDVSAVNNATVEEGRPNGLGVAPALRPLFALDDATDYEYLSPHEPVEELPRVCVGHGTGVAATADATANNGIGIAGVAYNAPLVGTRLGMPWDAPNSQLAKDDTNTLRAAVDRWERTQSGSEATIEDLTRQLAIQRAMGVPVVNMSFGAKGYLKSGKDAHGGPAVVVSEPALFDAFAREFSTGAIIGVTAAGNSAENYGSGPKGTGAKISSIELPCALPLLRNRSLVTDEDGVPHPYHPPVDWDHLLLMCVGATTSNRSQLWSGSAFGTSSVDIVAPGKNITTAARPIGDGDAGGYVAENGTSLSAPMVSGAVALLREAAPQAPLAEIVTALRRGARPAPWLTRKVVYGQLDVACALDWLNRERARLNANWGMINTLSTPQFQAATSTCARLRPVRVEGTLDITTGQLYGRNGRSFADLTDGLNPTVIGNSLAWQGVMLSGLGLSPDRPDRVAFAFRTGKAVTFPEGTQLYNGGVVSLACDTPGFRLSQIEVRVTDTIRPFGWFYPTDLSAPPKGVQLGVVLEQPWYWRLLPSTIHVQAQAWCYAGG